MVVGVSIGVALLALLAIADLIRKGREATRWREYLFLFSATLVCMAYGLAHDMIAVTIAPEYFLGPWPPSSGIWNARAMAALAAMKGTWWAGLILGAAMLLANNPSQRWPQLSRLCMYRKLIYPFLGAGVLAFILGAVAWSGWLGEWPEAGDNEKLRRIECVLYVDYGAYLGGFLAGIATVLLILHQRKKLALLISKKDI